MKKLAIVILNWNTVGLLRKFVPSVLDSIAYLASTSIYKDVELIVADNASTDGSIDMMSIDFPQVRTMVLERNYGFTGAYNRVFAGLQGQYEYYLLLNSDIEVPENWLQSLIEWMESHTDCGACSPKLHSWHNREMFEYAGAAGGLIDSFGYPYCRGRVMGMIAKDEGQYDKEPSEVFWASGACLMVRSGLYHKLGGLDERFFAHMEEIDLCWRMQLSGYKVCVVPQSVVYHVGGGTLPSTSPWKLKMNFRNNLLMLDNNLAKSFAVAERRKNKDYRRVVRKALNKAQRLIFFRMLSDAGAALVYLCTLKSDYFNAVLEAHREFKEKRHKNAGQMLESWLSENRDDVTIHGWTKEWIVAKALICRKIVL